MLNKYQNNKRDKQIRNSNLESLKYQSLNKSKSRSHIY